MKHLTTVLILMLASTNASKYYRPEQEFQQEPRDAPYLAIALNEEQFVPLVEEAANWESPLDPRMVLIDDLDSLENFLQNKEKIVYKKFATAILQDPNDFRIKRTKTSLSIDNPLDVLRQQFFKAYARRMKNKFIEKNREHLLKTGKRSGKEAPLPLNLVKSADFQSQKDFTENESEETDNNHRSEQKPTRRYQNRLDHLSYHT